MTPKTTAENSQQAQFVITSITSTKTSTSPVDSSKVADGKMSVNIPSGGESSTSPPVFTVQLANMEIKQPAEKSSDGSEDSQL